MFGFLKKLFGLPTTEEIAAAKKVSAPYKVEPPVVNNKTGDVVDTPPIPYPELHKAPEAPVEFEAKSRDDLIKSTVNTSEPVKKTRKPRTPKAEKTAKEKAAKPVKAAAKKVAVKRSKKV